MLRSLALSLSVFALAYAQFETDDVPFDQWVGSSGKVYSSPVEATYRKTIYEANIERIKAHNMKSNEFGFTMGINDFADLTADEWTALYTTRGLILEDDPNVGQDSSTDEVPVDKCKKLRCTAKPSPVVDSSASPSPYPNIPSASATTTPWAMINLASSTQTGTSTGSSTSTSTGTSTASSSPTPSRSQTPSASGIPSKLPSASSTASKLPSPSSANTIVPTQTGTTVDWQTAGKVTAVRNQGSCGSCYSFATAAAAESWTAITQGTLPSLSMQQIVDCDSSNFGCGGGYITSSLQYIANNGLCALSTYPYTSSKGGCAAASCARVTKTNGYRNVQSNSQSALENALRTVPVVVAIDAGTQAWQFYQSGIVTSNCGTSLNHAVLAVGFGTDSSTGISYWRIKNSWGGSWGESGYIRLGRGSQYGSQGTCGILMQASYPV